jgi:protein-L-isoaspartate O-methyltransferase
VRTHSKLLDMVSASAFEARYHSQEDPWNYRSSSYERTKYEITLRALSKERYAHAFEPGCSIGELTALLASRCDRLLATDIAPTAVVRARARCRELHNVQIECRDLRLRQPTGPFDLILLSEIAYYFDAQVLAEVAMRLNETLAAGGELIAVHWTGHSIDHWLHADEAHQVLHAKLRLDHTGGVRHPGFRIDCWSKI